MGASLTPEATARARRRLLAVWLAAAVGFGALLALARASESGLDDPDPAQQRPGFLDAGALPQDETRTITLEQLRGHPVVLNFWASWCVPCRKEMPSFQAVYRQMGDQVAFLGMNHQDSRDDAMELLRKTGVRYPSGFDPRGRVAQAYALYGMPTTVFISAEGRILASRTGQMSASQLTEVIRDLFAMPVPDGRGVVPPTDMQRWMLV